MLSWRRSTTPRKRGDVSADLAFCFSSCQIDSTRVTALLPSGTMYKLILALALLVAGVDAFRPSASVRAAPSMKFEVPAAVGAAGLAALALGSAAPAHAAFGSSLVTALPIGDPGAFLRAFIGLPRGEFRTRTLISPQHRLESACLPWKRVRLCGPGMAYPTVDFRMLTLHSNSD